MLIINAEIMTMSDRLGVIKNGYIEIKDKKIASIGNMADAPEADVEVIDAGGRLVTPGLVDAHSHIGMWEDGLTFEGDDGNEDTEPITPHLRAIDGINPLDAAFSEALNAGITTVVTGPGSANPIGGQAAALKTRGRRVDDMIIKAPVGMKIALGENPKTTYNDKSRSPVTRMATASLIREALREALDYKTALEKYGADPENEDKPDFDIKSEALLPVLRREIPLHAHAHRADDIFTAIRIAREFDLDLILVHCTEGHLIADELAREGFPVLSGPILTDRSKPELKNQTEASAGMMERADIDVSIITDHPETPEKFLPLCAAVAAKYGMSKDGALRAITINPARACGIDDRVGSLEPGKDGDLVIWDGDPLSIEGSPYKVIC